MEELKSMGEFLEWKRMKDLAELEGKEKSPLFVERAENDDKGGDNECQ